MFKRNFCLAALSIVCAAASADQPKKIALIAGKPSHGAGQHEYNAGCLLLKQCLDHVPQIEVNVYNNGWPADTNALNDVDAVLIYADGASKNPAIQENHAEVLDALAKKGVGIGFAHFALEVPKDKGGPEFQKWIGGYYENLFSCNPFF